jgi:hypothetical protein
VIGGPEGSKNNEAKSLAMVDVHIRFVVFSIWSTVYVYIYKFLLTVVPGFLLVSSVPHSESAGFQGALTIPYPQPMGRGWTLPGLLKHSGLSWAVLLKHFGLRTPLYS